MSGRALFAGFYALLFIGTRSFAGTDIWLAATNNINPWPGTSNAPFYAGDETAFTAILTTNNANCTFHYAPGTYRTLGWRFHLRNTANAGCKHFGAGIGQTIIQLVGAQPGCSGIIFGSDPERFPDGFEAHDMTLDCNATNNPVYISGQGACHAVSLGASDIWLSDLRIVGFGTGSPDVECNPMGLGPTYPPQAPRTNIQNVVIENCTFTSPAPTNAATVSCATSGGFPGYVLSNVVIRSCTASNVPGNAFYAPLVENCLMDNCENGVYIEPGPQGETNRDWIIRSNTFRNVTRGIFINSGGGQSIKSLTVIGNQFQPRCDNNSAAFGVAWVNPSQNCGLGWLTLNSNTVFDANCSGVANAGFYLAHMDRAVVEGNRITLASGRLLCVDVPSVTSRWFAGNVGAGNSPLLVGTNGWSTVTDQATATAWNLLKPPQVVRLQVGP